MSCHHKNLKMPTSWYGDVFKQDIICRDCGQIINRVRKPVSQVFFGETDNE